MGRKKMRSSACFNLLKLITCYCFHHYIQGCYSYIHLHIRFCFRTGHNGSSKTGFELSHGFQQSLLFLLDPKLKLAWNNNCYESVNAHFGRCGNQETWFSQRAFCILVVVATKRLARRDLVATTTKMHLDWFITIVVSSQFRKPRSAKSYFYQKATFALVLIVSWRWVLVSFCHLCSKFWGFSLCM